MRLALLGNPVSHSLSPLIFSKLAQKTGSGISYQLREVSTENLGSFFDKDYLEFDGVNVTLPHKLDVLKYAEELSDEVKKIGAANTLVFGKKIKAYNTDYLALKNIFRKNKLNSNSICLVYGAGGAARACAFALASLGIRQIDFVNRSFERVESLILDLEKHYPDLRSQIFSWDDRRDERKYDGFFQMSSIELSGNESLSFFNESTSPAFGFKSNAIFLDAFYKPIKTKFLRSAPDNLKKINGLKMLSLQAIYSYKLWLGERV